MHTNLPPTTRPRSSTPGFVATLLVAAFVSAACDGNAGSSTATDAQAGPTTDVETQAQTDESTPSTTDPPVPPTTRIEADGADDADIADSTDIALVASRTVTQRDRSWTVEFYRNRSLGCGRDGNFTFVVIEPFEGADRTAPLWVYLHGGGVGYYNGDDPPRYLGDEGRNDEESLDQLLVQAVGNGRDTTVNRRLRAGWRVLVPSMCDHDLHTGEGSTYPNNPRGADSTVDGLTANRAAVHWVAENRPTGWVVVHGTSAGSVGAFALSFALHEVGVEVNAAIMDAYLVTPRLAPYMDAGVTPQVRNNADFDITEVVEKVGRFADTGPGGVFPERVVADDDFRAIPLLDIVGDADAHCAGGLPPLPATNGVDNCTFVHGGFAASIDAQADSPHGQIIIAGGGHSTTKRPGPVNDLVDDWLDP